MSTRSKNKRLLSDVTNEAPPATKTKKVANRKQTKDEYWSEFEEYLASADHIQSEELVKDMFEQLWKTSGEKAALAITEPFKKKMKMDEEKNEQMADSTWLIDNGGTLTIDHDIGCVSFSNSSVDVDDFELELYCNRASDTLEYTGTTDCWEECQDDFKAELQLTYYAFNDSIQGRLDVSPSRVVHHYGRGSKRGGMIVFTAKRKPAKENKHQRLVDTFWELNDGGILTICCGISDASICFRNSWKFREMWGLKLSSDENSNILVYKGDAHCRVQYELTLEYDPERDIIKGKMKMNPHSSRNNDSIDFIATRTEGWTPKMK